MARRVLHVRRCQPDRRIDGGFVRGAGVAGAYSFRGLPYAAPPTGNLRWRAPQPAAPWPGVPDATQFGPSCWQPAANNPFFPPGPVSEDCLYLNVSMPAVTEEAGLAELRARYRDLAAQIAQIGFTASGTVLSTRNVCGTAGCSCHADHASALSQLRTLVSSLR